MTPNATEKKRAMLEDLRLLLNVGDPNLSASVRRIVGDAKGRKANPLDDGLFGA